ncbi:MAG: sigma-54 dependent transcriptional regulator [Bacteroidia bacterium]
MKKDWLDKMIAIAFNLMNDRNCGQTGAFNKLFWGLSRLQQNASTHIKAKLRMSRNFMISIFLVEDEEIFGKVVARALEKEGNYNVTLFKNGTDMLAQLHLNPDIVIADHYLPDMTGIEILEHLKRYNQNIIPVMVSGQERVEVVVHAYKMGAKDYIVKNQSAVVEIVNSIKNLSGTITLQREVETLREKIIDRHRYRHMIGESKPVLSVLRLVQKVEQTNMLVMLTGESGTGKEVIANAIHYNSPRKRNPFVAVNMAAIPEDLVQSELFGHEKGSFTGADSRRIGKFEESHKGTIFLDEIGEMDLSIQSQLLRVLQESKITRVGGNKEIPLDVRIIAATNRNLAQMVQEGTFRDDLFYRLQGFLIHLPPLRDRGNDIIILAKHFLAEFTASNRLGKKTLSKEVIEALLLHDWPGNIRELKSLIERAAIISDEDIIYPEDLIFSAGEVKV